MRSFIKSLRGQSLYMLNNLRGWRTKRKIVVIESDDWGSIRMPSLKVREMLEYEGVILGSNRYNLYDNLANNDDLSMLFDVLCSVKDMNGNYARLTPLSLIANPDFNRIEQNDFKEYHYETLTETLERYGKSFDGVFELWHQGIAEGIFDVQFHGREHLNVNAWLKKLVENDFNTKTAFKYKLFGIDSSEKSKRACGFMSAFEYNSEAEKDYCISVVKDGLKLFNEILGYKPVAFMAPCGIWGSELEKNLHESGIGVIQSGPAQRQPFSNSEPFRLKKKIHYTGQFNEYNQHYTVRNCRFEPGENNNVDSVQRCLNEIQRAFSLRKPAIISSHRVNFIGSLVEKNRNSGLKDLKNLLTKVKARWPDIEFMNSKELAECIMNNRG